ncbi:MAG: alkaline phosphatase [Phycisphaerales bacterium]|nr:alkaline phosphatase [Phycisphaerales bacterium]
MSSNLTSAWAAGIRNAILAHAVASSSGAVIKSRRAGRVVRMEAMECRQLLTAVTVTNFQSGTTGLGMKGTAFDALGNLWIAEPGTGLNQGRIGEVLVHGNPQLNIPAGTFYQFNLPTLTNRPQWITAGSDGNMWFTESPGNAIARITPAGTVTEFPLATANSNPQQIIAASDGNLWFTEFNSSKIGRITTSGTITEFSTLFASDGPLGLTDRGDGNIWFTGFNGNHVGFQALTSGVSGETTLPTPSSKPYGIVQANADTNLYFTESATDQIGRISGLFNTIQEIPVTAGSAPANIINGFNGDLYFAEYGSGKIGRLNAASFSVTAEYGFGNTVGSNPTDLKLGPDDNIYFTESGLDRIGRLNVYADADNFKAQVTPNPKAGQSFSGEVATFTSSLADSQAGDFLVNIDWGDGTLPTPGTIVKGADGKFFVSGTHTYADVTNGSPDTLTVTLTRSNGRWPLTASTAVNVDDNGPPVPPAISIGDVTQNEGDSGTSAYSFTVTRTGNLSGVSVVQFATGDGTATTADSDYQAQANTLTFAAGQVSKTITVLVNGDTNVEPDETFKVTLSSPTNATLVTAQGNGTITNDDVAPPPPPTSVSISNVMTTEGNSGTKNYTFTVTRSGDLSGTSMVHFATADGTAKVSDNDYVANSGTLTFAAGQASKTITVAVNGDTKVEIDESFQVNLSSPTNASISDGQGIGTIKNDDAAPAKPKLSIGGFTATEGNSGTKAFTFKVTLDKSSNAPITVHYNTADGTAHAGSDYTSASGTLTFAAGETFKMITIYIKADTTHEADENFFVYLTSPTNADLAVNKGTGLIKNDD